ncbi:MAG TPA: GNVR domain-containing protein, partial [Gemmatimonadaceae bacterium]|nr:GNVR domain-containing protein [Gemmatimonadaceae bacterium]
MTLAPFNASNGGPGHDGALADGGDAPLSFARFLAGTLARARVGAVAGGITALLVLLSAVILPPVYRSRASFMANSGGGLKLPTSLGNLTGLAGSMVSELGAGIGSDPSESPTFYVQLLGSRELLTRLAESRFPDPRTAAPADSARLVDILTLRPTQPRRRMERAVSELEGAMILDGDVKTNLVRLSVDLPYAELSALVANRAMELVDRFNLEQRSTRAGAKRAFLEGRVEQALAELTMTENRHRAFLEQNRVYNSPSLAAEEERLMRQAELTRDLYTSLRREYETARVNEVNDAPVITIVDSAVTPARPRWPRPGPLVVLALVAGGLVGALAAACAALLADWAR